jgi:hypothetical protein
VRLLCFRTTLYVPFHDAITSSLTFAIFPLPDAILPPFLQTQTQFGGNTLFQKALKDAFNDLVNRDVGKFKTADLIASFCDRCECLRVAGVRVVCVSCAGLLVVDVDGA